MRSDDRDTRIDVGTAATSTDTGRPAPGGGGRRPVAGTVGAAGGAAAGATVGTVTLGPIGAIVGAIAGAVGGGWSGLAAGAPTHYTPEHDREYRAHFESDPERVADRTYDAVRPAYQLGHYAARNPDYARREFEAVEADLQRGWSDEIRARHGEWQVARRYAREAFVRERARAHGRTPVELNMGGTETHQRPSFADPIPPGDPDRVAGDRLVPGRESPGNQGGAAASES
ncbi:MAG: hypothetical protein ABR499_12370 [Gemmatimonadaceae bacterium]